MIRVLRCSNRFSPLLLRRAPQHCIYQAFSQVKEEVCKSVEDTKSSRLKIKKSTAKGEGDINPAWNTREDTKQNDIATLAGEHAMHVTKVGAAANMALAISKGTIGFSISSTGLIADAANSLGDLLSDAVVFYSVTEARKRATPDRPWGRGKIEPLGK